MSRPSILGILPLVTLCVGLAGCGTLYTDVFSPKPNRFVPPAQKPIIPIVPAPPAVGDTTPSDPRASSSPSTVPSAPVVLPGDAMPGLQ